MKRLFFHLIILFISHIATANTYYFSSSSGNDDKSKDETVRLRQQMQAGAKDVVRAVEKLAVLANTGGHDVFGSFDAVEDIKNQLQTARDTLSSMGPRRPVIIEDDEDDEDVA